MKGEALQARKYDIVKVRFDLVTYDVAVETIERWEKKISHLWIACAVL